MNKLIFYFVFWASISTNWCLGADAVKRCTVEIFQKDAIKSVDKYVVVLETEMEVWRSNIKSDDALTSVVVAWKNNGVPLDLITAYINSLAPDFYAKSSLVPKERTSIVTKHDLSIGGGECAWVLEQLLDCKFPPVTLSTSPDTLGAIQETARTRLKEICAQPLVEEDLTKTVDLSQYNTYEKVKMAKDTVTSSAALDKLARDEDPEVRRAVAQNPNTATVTLWMLRGTASHHLSGRMMMDGNATLSIPELASSHPKLWNAQTDGNYLFLRAKKK